jgi:flagellar protein FliO/FliZ
MSWDIYAKAIGALVFVLGMIAGAAWLARRFGAAGGAMMRRSKRRLGLIEALPLDGRRRLLLIRRDGVEHLLLVGGGGDLVIESGLAGFSGQLLQAEEREP